MFLCLAAFGGGWVCEARGEAEQPPTVGALLAEALERSAELAGMRASIAAAEAGVVAAGALPDPMASVGLNNIPVGELSLDRDMMSSVGVMLSQRVTAGVRRRLRAELQRGEAAALRARYQSMENGIVRQVKQAYFDLQYLDGALQIAEENKRLAQDLLAVAESLYATGKVGQQDVFQSQVQLTRMLDALVAL